MYRFIENHLLHWKNQTQRKPLIVRGARQVGKTYSILQFGRNHFPGRVHHIDLEKQTNLHIIFEPDLDAKRILSELELAVGVPIQPGKDLLFFDEIQNVPRAISALRYFYEDIPDLHVIAAGSLLEFAFNGFSFPVGRIQFLDMYPMSFMEFVLALGNESAIKTIFGDLDSLTEATHQFLLDLVRRYLFIGGMPESVRIYAETQKLLPVFEVQRNLIETFKEDFSKYSSKVDSRCLNAVLINSARSVGEQVVYTRLADGFTGPTNKKAFELLTRARLIRPITAIRVPQIPLGATANPKKLKPLFLDVGLMQSLIGVQITEEYYKKDLLSIYQGKLAEQFVGQELLAYGIQELYYWARQTKSSNAEVDFIIEKEGMIYPIEVKSGSGGRLKSLHLLLKTNPHIEKAYVISSAKPGRLPEQRLEFLPLYALSKPFMNQEWLPDEFVQ